MLSEEKKLVYIDAFVELDAWLSEIIDSWKKQMVWLKFSGDYIQLQGLEGIRNYSLTPGQKNKKLAETCEGRVYSMAIR